MGYSVVKSDITELKADIIVNASNGIGYMGGVTGKFIKFKGIAESIHYKTKGAVEREAKEVSKRNKYLPRYLCGYNAGEIFVTRAGNLYASYIIHAVTMKFPGMTTNIDVIKALLPKIMSKAHELKAKTLAIPLLGTGTGKVEKDKVLRLYEDFFKNIKDIEIIISYIN
ncbi:TPA: macro domain-containing protein [Clostridium botulinum]|nr:macro domain-containing protein [Clostridium botulinum]